MKKVKCPACGKLAKKGSLWEAANGTCNKMYIHETKLSPLGFEVVTKSCMVNEPCPPKKLDKIQN